MPVKIITIKVEISTPEIDNEAIQNLLYPDAKEWFEQDQLSHLTVSDFKLVGIQVIDR